MIMTLLLCFLTGISFICILFLLVQLRSLHSQQSQATQQLQQLSQTAQQADKDRLAIAELLKQHQQAQQEQRERFDQHQMNSLKLLQEFIGQAMGDVRQQIVTTLQLHTEALNQQFNTLAQETKQRLHDINQEVNKQLASGFEKTTSTFGDVMKRLTIIDQAQKKITELSSNVMSLQEILTDKRSRGAFGEVQLAGLIHNMIPENHFSLQHTLSNGKRADCILFLPEPTGNVVIDAKFPLETYQQFSQVEVPSQLKVLETQFRNDIRKHIDDIAEKYIIAGETSDGAMMFIPAEAIFAEIHAHYPDVVQYAHRMKVWLVSPTTLMAVLTTARAVLKDAATRKQVNIIQQHLIALSKDFDRFQKRMDALSKHIGQAKDDVDDVHKSSKKISSRFQKIEKVELSEGDESEDNVVVMLEQVTED